MTTESILKKYARPATLLSSEPVKSGLLSDLRDQKTLNSRIYGILFGFVSILTVLALCALAFDLINGRAERTAVLITTGTGIPFCIELMRRTVREWSQLNLLITLVSHSDETSIQMLISKLLTSPASGLSPISGQRTAER